LLSIYLFPFLVSGCEMDEMNCELHNELTRYLSIYPSIYLYTSIDISQTISAYIIDLSIHLSIHISISISFFFFLGCELVKMNCEVHDELAIYLSINMCIYLHNIYRYNLAYIYLHSEPYTSIDLSVYPYI